MPHKLSNLNYAVTGAYTTTSFRLFAEYVLLHSGTPKPKRLRFMHLTRKIVNIQKRVNSLDSKTTVCPSYRYHQDFNCTTFPGGRYSFLCISAMFWHISSFGSQISLSSYVLVGLCFMMTCPSRTCVVTDEALAVNLTCLSVECHCLQLNFQKCISG